MTKMRKVDLISIEIFELLKKNYKELSAYVGEYSNIIGVFFHEIMIFLTNFVLLKNSIGKYNNQVELPFLNSNYVENPYIINYNYSSRKYFIRKVVKKRSLNDFLYYLNFLELRFLEVLSNLNKEKTTLGLINKQRFEIYNIVRKNRIHLLEQIPKLILVEKNFQLNFLREILYSIFIYLNVPDKNYEIMIESFLNYVKTKLTDKNIKIKPDIFISNSNAILSNRIYSSYFKLFNKKVIAFSHGFSSFLELDEPIIGYGELSYCDYYVDFGSNTQNFFTKFQTPINISSPIIKKISSKPIERIFKTKIIKHRLINKQSKILYIPNAFVANQRYGPFRDIEDYYYLMWQKSLLSCGYNIYYKIHPNNVVFYKELLEFKIITETLNKVIQYFDLLILDFLGSAYSICCASDKPTIYFNFGLRNLVNEAFIALKNRFFWYDIDINLNFKEQILDAFEKYNKQKEEKFNLYSEIYSLNSKPNANQPSIINEIVKEIINSQC